MKTLLLIDGNALMHRAFHALPAFKTQKGLPTNVVYGFLSMLHKALSDFKPSHLVVCFDTPTPTFRNKLYKEYQMQRPVISDEFKIQVPYVKEALDQGGIFHIEKEGFEADDLIGTIAVEFKKKHIKVLVLSGDRDILQLVNDSVFVITPKIGISDLKLYDASEVQNKFEIPPHTIPDLKALAGDPSDNYKGAKGIGPKTAAKLLKEYGTVEHLLSKLATLKNSTIKKLLKEHKKHILLSKKLATIVTNVALDYSIAKTEFHGWNPHLKSYLLETMEMKGLVKKLFDNNHTAKEKTKETKKDPQVQIGLF